MRLITLIFCLMFSITCFGGTRDPGVSDQQHIEYAKNTDYIVKLYGQNSKKENICASAVAITNRWLVTAAHIVKDGQNFYIKSKDRKINIEKFTVHKDFKQHNYGYHDIAVCFLAEDLALDFYPELYTDSDEVGKTVYICGYGMTGTFQTGVAISDQHKRAGTNVIERTEKSVLVCDIGTKNKTKLEFLICGGDSGGGLFIGNKLAGVNSCVTATDGLPDSSYGDESNHTRISIYYDWINEHTNYDLQKK